MNRAKKKATPEQIIEHEALWCYRFMKHTGQDVDYQSYSAPIQAFKKICLIEGDYRKPDGTKK